MVDRFINPVTGNDSGAGTSANPWKTLTYSYGACLSGDSFILDGSFSLLNLGPSNFVNFATAKDIIWRSRTDYSGRIIGSAANVLVYQDGFGTAVHQFGDILFGGASLGGTDPTSFFNWFSVGGGTLATLSGSGAPRIVDPCGDAMLIMNKGVGTAKGIFDLTGWVIDTSQSVNQWPVNSKFINALLGIVAGSSVKLDRMQIIAPNAYHTSRLIDLNAKDSTVPFTMSGLSMALTTSRNPGARCTALSVRNSNFTHIDRAGINVTTSSASGTSTSFNGIQVDCDDAALNANNAVIENSVITVDGDGGIAVIAGHDATNAFNGRMANAILSNLKVRGTARFQAGNGHGPMLGWCQGRIADSDISTVSLGIVMKGCTNSVGVANETRNCLDMHLLHKANTNCDYVSNRCYLNGTALNGAAMYAQADGAVNNSGVRYINNQINLGGGIGYVFFADPAQDTSLQSNHYYDAGTPLRNPIANDGGATYATLPLLAAAKDTNYRITSGFAPITGAAIGVPTYFPGKGIGIPLN